MTRRAALSVAAAGLLVGVVLADVVVAWVLHLRDLLVYGRPARRPDRPGRW